MAAQTHANPSVHNHVAIDSLIPRGSSLRTLSQLDFSPYAIGSSSTTQSSSPGTIEPRQSLVDPAIGFTGLYWEDPSFVPSTSESAFGRIIRHTSIDDVLQSSENAQPVVSDDGAASASELESKVAIAAAIDGPLLFTDANTIYVWMSDILSEAKHAVQDAQIVPTPPRAGECILCGSISPDLAQHLQAFGIHGEKWARAVSYYTPLSLVEWRLLAIFLAAKMCVDGVDFTPEQQIALTLLLNQNDHLLVKDPAAGSQWRLTQKLEPGLQEFLPPFVTMLIDWAERTNEVIFMALVFRQSLSKASC